MPTELESDYVKYIDEFTTTILVPEEKWGGFDRQESARRAHIFLQTLNSAFIAAYSDTKFDKYSFVDTLATVICAIINPSQIAFSGRAPDDAELLLQDVSHPRR